MRQLPAEHRCKGAASPDAHPSAVLLLGRRSSSSSFFTSAVSTFACALHSLAAPAAPRVPVSELLRGKMSSGQLAGLSTAVASAVEGATDAEIDRAVQLRGAGGGEEGAAVAAGKEADSDSRVLKAIADLGASLGRQMQTLQAQVGELSRRLERVEKAVGQ